MSTSYCLIALCRTYNEKKNLSNQVLFITPVSTVEHPKINEWLSLVEKEMRVTLACRLKDAVTDGKQFKDGSVDPVKFIEWCDKYQVS